MGHIKQSLSCERNLLSGHLLVVRSQCTHMVYRIMTPMDAIGLLRIAIDQSGNQIRQTYRGLNPCHADASLAPGAMTFLQTLDHLSECCLALSRSVDGEAHAWGSFRSEAEGLEGKMAEFWALREEGVAKALAEGSESALRHALDFIALHEAYHVGQLALLRSRLEPDWDFYAIYRPLED